MVDVTENGRRNSGGTRSARHETAVLLAAHGDRGGGGQNRALIEAVGYLHREGDFLAISGGVLKGEPLLEDALAELVRQGPARILVYPLFMADGYFAREVLPERLSAGAAGVPFDILAPLGADPELPGLMLGRARMLALAHSFDPGATRLLIVGHGSKFSPASADATRRLADQIRAGGGNEFAVAETAFLEEAPLVDDALADDPARPTIVLGFFSGDGMHAGDDIPRAIARAGATAVYSGPIGTGEEIPAMIARSLEAACN